MILAGDPISPVDAPRLIIPLLWVSLTGCLVLIRAPTADRVRSGKTSRHDR